MFFDLPMSNAFLCGKDHQFPNLNVKSQLKKKLNKSDLGGHLFSRSKEIKQSLFQIAASHDIH